MTLLLKRYWRFLITAAAIVVLTKCVGLRELFSVLASLQLRWLAVFVALFGVILMLYGLQIWVALRLLSHRLPLRHAIRAALQSWSVGQLTPARSGDLSLAYLVGDAAPPGSIVAVVVTDKLFAIACLSLIACATALYLGLHAADRLVAVTCLIFGGIGLALLLLRLRWLPSPLRRASDRLFGQMPRHTYQTLHRIIRSRPYLMLSAGSVIARWTLACLANLALFKAVGYEPRFVTVLAATAIGQIISLVPVSIGGVGLKEPVQIVIYRLDGVPAQEVVAVSIVGLAILLLLAAALPLCLSTRVDTKREIQAP